MPQESANSQRDRHIARVAANQHGLITSTQPYAAGISASSVTDRVRAGRLIRIHRGVYAVGHRGLSQEGRWMAAMLAVGGDAVLSQGAPQRCGGCFPHPASPTSALRQAEYLRLPIGDRIGVVHTRSELEARFLRMCRRHRLPSPEVDVRVGPYLVDFLWREQRVIVEVDGYRAHAGRQAFEDDRARDAALTALG